MKSDGKKKKTSPDYSQMGKQALEVSRSAPECKPEPGLYVVATPIGNLGDITLRALALFDAADSVYCEDTRVTGGLLTRFGLAKPLVACHDHNEERRAAEIVARVTQGEVVALASDAGMPLISDPGYRVVAACRAAGVRVEVLPGASALTTALAGAGLPSDRFLFQGFLPNKTAARRRVLEELRAIDATLIFYESPQRLATMLADATAVLGPRAAVLARELTKLFEDYVAGTLETLASHFAETEVKGECVVLVAPPEAEAVDDDATIDARLCDLLATHSLKESVARVAAETRAPRKTVYARALALMGDKEEASATCE
jgi:16S rRNA (cytidine1402-2'-O)-methyltransferase